MRLGGLPWLRAWEQDTITTADCVLTGAVFKGQSKTLGEVRVRVKDVRSVHGAGDGLQQAANGHAKSDEQNARRAAELLRRLEEAYKAGTC